jgi:acyl-CoA synthetase (AMP-forming)/AMP-acid ligase II
MVHRSPYPDVELPEAALADFVLAGGAAHADAPALIDGPTGAVTTHAEMAAQVRGAAAALDAAGLRPGDVVALLSPNVPGWPVAFYGALSLGAAVTPLNPLQTPAELAKQIGGAGARLVVAAAPLLEPARAAAALADDARVLALDELAGSGSPPAVTVDPGAIAVLPYSSGTTGLPKGVLLDHRALVADLAQTHAVHEMRPTDVVAGVLPFFHSMGQWVMNLTLAYGGAIVTLPRFELPAFLAMVQERRITVAHAVPPIVIALANAPIVDDYDLSSLRLVACGAAPLDEATALRAEARLGCPVRQGFGMTESGPVTHVPADDRLLECPPGSIGWLVPQTEARVVDPATGEDTDGPGEMWVRGPQLMRGYLHDPEATARTITADGWLRTGDVVEAGDDGTFRVVDRLKELIKYKAYQVAPAELEGLLRTHPAVADAAVVPQQDPACGEIPKACVVLREDVDPDALMAWVAERVAPYKRVRAVEVLDAIPRSPSGKILRRLLRDGAVVA